MCGFIFAIGLACLAPATATNIGHQPGPTLAPMPLPINLGVTGEPPAPVSHEASERDASTMFDVSLDEDALFWRFDVEQAFMQWNLCKITTVANFDPIVVKRNEPQKPARDPSPAASPAKRVNVQPNASEDQLSNTAAIGPSSRLESPLSHLPLATSIREGASVLAPLAFVRFCNQYASQCNFERSGMTVALDGETWKSIENVNLDVNRSIQPVADAYESWDLGVKRGDCDDFAVEKRRQLIARGLPAAALSLTEVVANGEGHLVLAVRTDRGTFILDNLRQSIVGWSMTGYRFVKIQSLERPSYWVAINGAEAPPVQVATRMARAAMAKKDALRRSS